jgi:transglutaminase-like putative cysteine protease
MRPKHGRFAGEGTGVPLPLITVRHRTLYRYRQPVALGEHRIMFRPRDSYDQQLLEARIDISPQPCDLLWVHDVFGNCVAIARFARRTRELRFVSTIALRHEPTNALEFTMADYARTYPFAYDAEEMPDLLRSMERQYPDPGREVDRWARQFIHRDRPTRTREMLSAMTHEICKRFTYVSRAEAGTQDPVRTLKLGSGSCRDFALLMMEAVRSLGLAARFVSGYLYVPPARGRTHQGGGNTHAWMQVYLPGAGWVEFDPTNGIVGNRDLIRVAVVRDPAQAVPLSGTWTGFPSDHLGMTVDVEVTVAPEAGAGAGEQPAATAAALPYRRKQE